MPSFNPRVGSDYRTHVPAWVRVMRSYNRYTEHALASADTLGRDSFSRVVVCQAGRDLSMPEPRHNENENKSRHAAADDDCCDEMAEKYGWQLVDVEQTGDPILPVDCVFEGETEFPKSYYDTDKEQD